MIVRGRQFVKTRINISTMNSTEASVLLRPESAELRFLPEGPYPYSDGWISWVAIQHGATATEGSLNLLELSTGENRTINLNGRPGFAFPTDREGVFLVGLERRLALVDIESGEETVLCDGVDSGVENTIINDGVAFDGGVIFGCKDLEFSTQKAGLYLFRSSDRQLIALRSDQICSNGKIILGTGQTRTLIDIDSPTKTVVRYELDLEAGTLSQPETVVDVTSGDVFPDGMIATPDGNGVIISFYNPNPAEAGETRQYSLADGSLQHVWQSPGSPQATCPQLVHTEAGVKLIVTTAVEHMPSERLAGAPNAGCLFVADTGFDGTPETPRFVIPD